MDRFRLLFLKRQASERNLGASQPAPECDDYEAWRDLQDVLDERDAKYWTEEGDSERSDEIDVGALDAG